jgi:hypothetical protein
VLEREGEPHDGHVVAEQRVPGHPSQLLPAEASERRVRGEQDLVVPRDEPEPDRPQEDERRHGGHG